MARNKKATEMVYENTTVLLNSKPKKLITFELFDMTAAIGK
jgi:hypothetical protein